MKLSLYKIIILAILVFLSMPIIAQNRWALLVGISNYDTNKTRWSKIHGTNDVAMINKALKGFKITKLTNSQATFDNIINSIKSLTNQVKPGDIAYIHLSGHGQPVEDLDGDEDDGWDEAFIPYDAPMTGSKTGYQGQHHLTDDILHNYILTLRKKLGHHGMLYVSIDACHSGSSYRGFSNDGNEPGKMIDDDFIATQETDNGNYERGSSAGFSLNNKTYSVIRSTGKIRGRISSSPELSKIVMLESCLSTEKSKEVKLTIKGKDGKVRNFYCGPLSYAIYKVLTQSKIQLSVNTSWVSQVRGIFDGIKQTDNDQQLVIESSE